MEALADRGVTGGVGRERYDPDSGVSRAQLATFMIRGVCEAGRAEPTGARVRLIAGRIY